MLTKSKWSMKILEELEELDFIKDVEFKSPSKDFYDFSLVISVEEEHGNYIKDVVKIIGDIELEILKDWKKEGELDRKKRFPSIEWEFHKI